MHLESQAEILLEPVAVAKPFFFNAPPELPKGKSNSRPPKSKGVASKGMLL